MNGRQWHRVMAQALTRHNDKPDLAEVCAVALQMYPQHWTAGRRDLLPAVAAFELRQTMKAVAFMRDSAKERGIDHTQSVAAIRALSALDIPEESYAPAPARQPLPHAQARV